jgi:hypothetical protein
MKCSFKNCKNESTCWSKAMGYCSKHSPFKRHHPKGSGGLFRKLKKDTNKIVFERDRLNRLILLVKGDSK